MWKKWEKKEAERYSVRTCLPAAGFEDGRKDTNQGMGVASRIWKKINNEMDSPLEPLGGITALTTS